MIDEGGKTHLVIVRAAARRTSVPQQYRRDIGGHDRSSGRGAAGVNDILYDGRGGREGAGGRVRSCAANGIATGERRKETGDDLVDLRRLAAHVRVVVEVEDLAVLDDTGGGGAGINGFLQHSAVPAV